MSQFGEVATVFGKVGRADTGTDPAPYSMAETTVRLRPRAEWPKIAAPRWYSSWAPAPLRAAAAAAAGPRRRRARRPSWSTRSIAAARLPGWTSAWTAPARARMDMMATGVRTPVGIRVVSPDPTAPRRARHGAAGAWSRALPGTRSAVFESLGGETWLAFDADPAGARPATASTRPSSESTATC